MNGRCHTTDGATTEPPWAAWVTKTNGTTTAAQSDAATRLLRHGVRKTMRSIASATRGRAAALGLQSIAHATNGAEAARSLRDRAWSLAWRERASTFSASNTK